MSEGSQVVQKQFSLATLSLSDAARILFIASYSIWLVASLFSVTFAASFLPYKAIRIGCLALLAACELLKMKYDTKAVLSLVVAGILIAANLPAGLGAYADLALYVAVSRSYDFRMLAKLSAVITTAVLVCVILLSDLSVLPTCVERGSRIREYLGFRYPLYPAQLMLTITCLVIYLRSTAFSVLDAFVLAVANYFIYSRTNSRFSFLLAVLLIAAALCIVFVTTYREKHSAKNRKRPRRKIIGYLAALVFPVAAIISVAVSLAYDPAIGWMAELNSSSYLSGRLSLGQAALQEYGVPLIGQSMNFIGNGLDSQGFQNLSAAYNYVDCAFICLLVEHGFIVFTLFVGFASYVCWKAWEANNYLLLAILIIIAMHCVIDDLSLRLYYNPFILLAGQAFASNGPKGFSV